MRSGWTPRRSPTRSLWAWSGAWLAFGAGLMAGGIRAGSKALRLAAIAVIGLTAAKVFMVDMADLVGLWRVLSFLGLGLTLIGLGAVYRRFVQPPLPRRRHSLHVPGDRDEHPASSIGGTP